MKKNKKDEKLINKYGDLGNKDFEGAIQKMLTKKPTKPATRKSKKKP